MCTCASCKLTDGFRDRGFAEWPKGNMRPIPRKLKDPVYDAHWKHCGAEFYHKPAALLGSPFPCTGTPQTDGRAGYAFPGGRAPLLRRWANEKPFPKETQRIPAAGTTAEYVAAFVAGNHLT